MPFVIDGHNLIAHLGQPGLADPDDEQQLVRLLRSYLSRVQRKGAVYFDQGLPGSGRGWSNSQLEVRFATPPRTADDLIRDRLQRERNPRGLVVVSADQEVAQSAVRAGATVLTPSEFVRRLRSGPPAQAAKEKGLSSEEVAEWEALFRKKR